MTNRMEVYKCEICGNIVMMMHEGKGELVCCGEAMGLMAENTVDAAKEKHVPVIEKTETGCTVKVGGVPHPMEDKHYIEWIELTAGSQVCLAFLRPGQTPEAHFPVKSSMLTAREYCNLHGLWKA